LLVAFVLFGLALSVNASDTSSAGALPKVHSLIPMCPPGEEAKLVDINGHYVWECFPVD
jgi:hypothetical protein